MYTLSVTVAADAVVICAVRTCTGVVTEYLRFGQAEGGVGDLAQLDRLMRALQVRLVLAALQLCIAFAAAQTRITWQAS